MKALSKQAYYDSEFQERGKISFYVKKVVYLKQLQYEIKIQITCLITEPHR